MRPFTALVSFETGIGLVREHAIPIETTERLQLADAPGRVLASDVVADVAVPPFDRAAMDGYAVTAADTAAAEGGRTVSLRLTGRVHAGAAWQGIVGRGECVAIATGAPLPSGADAVVMVEHTAVSGGHIEVQRTARPGQHVGLAGSDIRAGAVVARRGQELTPGRVGAVAAVGTTAVEVFSQPSVAVVVTGDELLSPGEKPETGRIYESNSLTLAAVTRRHGGRPVMFGIVPDTLGALTEMLDRTLAHDIVVFTGGSSVGDRDLMLDVIGRRARVVFHGLAVKPGKPTLFAIADSIPIFGMPGNPASCLSNAYLLLVPLLRMVARLPPWRPERLTLPLTQSITSPSDRHQFLTVRIVDDAAEPAFRSSSDTTSMANADGFIEIPAGQQFLDAGTLVTVTRF